MRIFKLMVPFLLLPLTAAAQEIAVLDPETPKCATILGGGLPADVVLPENELVDVVSSINEGDFALADRALDSLLRVYPENDALQYYRGVTLFSLRDPRGAVERLEKAVALDSTNVWYKETLATAYATIGDGAKAGKIYLDLSRLNPRKFQNAYTVTLIADCYKMQSDMKGYFSCLTKFVTDPNLSAETKSKYLGTTLGTFHSNNFNALLPQIDSLMQAFVKAEPDAPEAHALRMEIAGYREDWETVIEECYAQMRLSQGDTSTVVSLLGYVGDCYHQLGDPRSAYKIYEQALKIDPDYCPVLNNYAYYLSEAGKRLSKAAMMSLRTIELEPDNPTYLDTYGWILYLQRKYKEAKPLFKHAMIYGGKDSEVILMHYSLVLSALGESDLSAYYKGLAEAKAKK